MNGSPVIINERNQFSVMKRSSHWMDLTIGEHMAQRIKMLFEINSSAKVVKLCVG